MCGNYSVGSSQSGDTGYRCMSSLLCERFGKCLSSSTKISTPTGSRLVTELKAGMLVWTADKNGKRVVASLVRVNSLSAVNHRVVHLVLADGRSFDVSPGHPTADGRTVGDLKAGEAYDGSNIVSAQIVPYAGNRTYDILPAGDTGFYWADGILIGSTLK